MRFIYALFQHLSGGVVGEFRVIEVNDGLTCVYVGHKACHLFLPKNIFRRFFACRGREGQQKYGQDIAGGAPSGENQVL